MKYYVGTVGKRVVVLNLLRGDKLLESIRSVCAEVGIRYGIITSAIGSLQRVHLHRVTSFAETPEDEYIVLEKPMELASLQGLIVEGSPHIHMVVSDVERTYTGHLEEGTVVLYLAEISIMELEGLPITRKKGKGNAVYFDTK